MPAEALNKNTASPSVPRPATQPLAARLRFAMLVLIGVYPLITALLYAVIPLTSGWSIWQRDLVVVPIMVVIMIFGLIPFVQKRFGDFISGRRQGA